MNSDTADTTGTSESQDPRTQDKTQTVRKPRKALPAKKLSSKGQFDVLRAFAIASTHEHNLVSINDVASVLDIHANSVSICNPFFNEVGLVQKQGHKFTPAQEVFDYSDRVQWDDKKAGHKLAPLIEAAWFSDALLPRVTLRAVTEDEALALFAQLSGATPEHKTQLIMLLDYMEFAGLISRDSGSITLGKMKQQHRTKELGKQREKEPEKKQPPMQVNPDTESFQIPIPDKAPAQIIVPKGLDERDWTMLKEMIDAYTKRLREEQKT